MDPRRGPRRGRAVLRDHAVRDGRDGRARSPEPRRRAPGAPRRAPIRATASCPPAAGRELARHDLRSGHARRRSLGSRRLRAAHRSRRPAGRRAAAVHVDHRSHLPAALAARAGKRRAARACAHVATTSARSRSSAGSTPSASANARYSPARRRRSRSGRVVRVARRRTFFGVCSSGTNSTTWTS